MTIPTVLVVVFAACALGLSVTALTVAVSARRQARDAVQAARAVAARLPRTDRRKHDHGPPEGEPERRRHRAPEAGERYPRLRASADAREQAEPARGPLTPSGSSSANDATTAIPAVGRYAEEEDLDQHATREHPAPDARFRRPPPPLPRPGSIGPR